MSRRKRPEQPYRRPFWFCLCCWVEIAAGKHPQYCSAYCEGRHQQECMA